MPIPVYTRVYTPKEDGFVYEYLIKNEEKFAFEKARNTRNDWYRSAFLYRWLVVLFW